MSDFVNLKEIKMAQLQAVPPAATEPTIAAIVQQAHKSAYDLRERMQNLGERSGVSVTAPGKDAQNPIASNMHSLSHDLLMIIESCHEAMHTLDRIA